MSATEQGLFGSEEFTTIIILIVITVVALIIERLITRYISRAAKRLKMEPHVTNNLTLTFRIFILIGAVIAAARVGGLATEWIISISAIGGAAVGFASQKTLGNFIAGVFLLAAKPFRAGDYVRIGTMEGIVQEITLNYTKILTIGNSTVSVSNLQLLDRDITNFAFEAGKEEVYSYTFEIGFDHRVATEKIGKIFEATLEKYSRVLPKKPTYMLVRSSGIERVYMVFLYVEKSEDIFTLRPRISEEVFQLWDQERAKT
jgi:small-conductance mechanosensitive channel